MPRWEFVDLIQANSFPSQHFFHMSDLKKNGIYNFNFF